MASRGRLLAVLVVATFAVPGLDGKRTKKHTLRKGKKGMPLPSTLGPLQYQVHPAVTTVVAARNRPVYSNTYMNPGAPYMSPTPSPTSEPLQANPGVGVLPLAQHPALTGVLSSVPGSLPYSVVKDTTPLAKVVVSAEKREDFPGHGMPPAGFTASSAYHAASATIGMTPGMVAGPGQVVPGQVVTPGYPSTVLNPLQPNLLQPGVQQVVSTTQPCGTPPCGVPCGTPPCGGTTVSTAPAVAGYGISAPGTVTV